MKVLVLGAGRMGFGAVFDLLRNSKDIESVTVVDSDPVNLESIKLSIGDSRLNCILRDAGNYEDMYSAFENHDTAISCVNYWYNFDLSKIAIETRTNFCDLGGNNSVVDQQLSLDAEAKEAGINVIPDCGLAPGMVSLLAAHGAKKLDQIDSIKIRVGGLPQDPKPPLDYQLVFSVEGLINEYIEKARVIRDGEIVEVDSMTEIESLEFGSFPPLEAFQTSGGTSTLPETFYGKIKNLEYKTIRYAGHCVKFKAMIDLGLCSSQSIKVGGNHIKPRHFFGTILKQNLPADGPDFVLVRVEFAGTKDGRPSEFRYDIIDQYDATTKMSAMMRTTSFPASIIAQMAARGEVNARGATPQEIAIDSSNFVAELEKRNIIISEY